MVARSRLPAQCDNGDAQEVVQRSHWPLHQFEEQKRSMEEANEIEEAAIERQASKPLMPVGLRALIPNLVTCIVILSGCILMTFASVLGLKPWAGVVVVFIGLLADILDGMTARKLKVGTKFGSFFDELADLTAFGIGPAVYFMRHGIDNGGSFLATRVVGYLYMLASVYRISRELVVHRAETFVLRRDNDKHGKFNSHSLGLPL